MSSTDKPIRDEYLIEAMGSDGRWWIRGSDRLSHIAQYYMRKYQQLEPRTAFRVVGHPSRTLIVLHDPLTDGERADAIGGRA